MSYENVLRRPSTLFNDFKYSMPKSIKPVDGAKYPAMWVWELGAKGNKVFFKVNDGFYGKEDKNAKLKEVELNAFERAGLFDTLREAIDNPDFTVGKVEIVRKRYNANTKSYSETPSLDATFSVIRSKNTGEIRVHYSKSTYEVVFAMAMESVKIKTRNNDNEFVLDPGLCSRAYTRKFIQFSERFLDLHEWEKYSREAKGGTSKPSGGNSSRDNDDTTDYSDYDDDF